MYRHTPRSIRIRPHRRPHRPPDLTHSNARFFARSSQLLLISAQTPRPQAPFLPQNAHRATQWRWLTTQKREYYKEQAWHITKESTAITILIACLGVAVYGFVQAVLEKEHPTPPEWGFWTRTQFRSALAQQKEDANTWGVVNWPLVGSLYRKVLRRLEDLNTDGAGLIEREEGGIDVPGAGKVGFDLSAKSEAWREGYYETLMGCAKVAEHLDGQLLDTTTGGVLPAHYVVGPSNPNPTPLPPYFHDERPREENCVQATPPPEHYYVQILTTKGFTPKQRLDAAIAYADWLDFKQLPETAEEMLKWARDIAEGSSRAQPVFDASYKPSDETTSLVSENQLTALSALATHYATTGRVSEALSMYLSALQQRRAAPYAGASAPVAHKGTSRAATDIEVLSRGWRTLMDFIGDPPYEAAPSTSYDEPLVKRIGDASACEEAKLETYIGEILFATATSEKGRADAINWTRDALDKADPLSQDKDLPLEKRLNCLSCVEVALSNWIKMASQMAEDEREGRMPGSGTSGWVPRSWRRRFGYVTAPVSGKGGETEERWQLEVLEALKRRKQLNREGLRDKLTNSPWAPFWQRVGWLMKF